MVDNVTDFKKILEAKSIEDQIQKTMETRREHLEAYAAAFFMEVGSHEASKYCLVERWLNPQRTAASWAFELKSKHETDSPSHTTEEK